MDAPEHGVMAGKTIREYLNSAADAIERTGEELVKHAQAELERAKEAQAESKNIADGFRKEAELKEQEILTQTTRARDAANHIAATMRIINGGSPNRPELEAVTRRYLGSQISELDAPERPNVTMDADYLAAQLNTLIEGGRPNPEEKSK